MIVADDVGLVLLKVGWNRAYVTKIMSKCLLVHREERFTMLFFWAQPNVRAELVGNLLALLDGRWL